jgi:hypothetical protein
MVHDSIRCKCGDGVEQSLNAGCVDLVDGKRMYEDETVQSVEKEERLSCVRSA